MLAVAAVHRHSLARIKYRLSRAWRRVSLELGPLNRTICVPSRIVRRFNVGELFNDAPDDGRCGEVPPVPRQRGVREELGPLPRAARGGVTHLLFCIRIVTLHYPLPPAARVEVPHLLFGVRWWNRIPEDATV
jgi:hypothetical protein